MRKRIIASFGCVLLLFTACSNETKKTGTITVVNDESTSSTAYVTNESDLPEKSSHVTNSTEVSESIAQTEYANSLVERVEQYAEYSEDGSIWYVDTLAPKADKLTDLTGFAFPESMGIEERMLAIINETGLPYLQVEKGGMPYYEDAQTGEITLPYTYWAARWSSIHPDDRTYTYDENESGCTISLLYYEYTDDEFIYNGDPKKNERREHNYEIVDKEAGFETSCYWDENGESERWLIKKTISTVGSETVECSIFQYDRENKNCYIFEVSYWTCGNNALSEEECIWLTKCVGLVDESIPISAFLNT